ncbi:MAG TPA: hypothetical protein VJJ28_02160 [Candidatus Paceibacterota bacterium]
METAKGNNHIAHLILRIGIAFSFLYSAISGFINPDNWIGYFPSFIQGILPVETMFSLWGMVEIILAIWILSGWKILIPSILGAFSLFGLIAFNLNQMDILFRDIMIMLTLIALAVWDRQDERQNEKDKYN